MPVLPSEIINHLKPVNFGSFCSLEQALSLLEKDVHPQPSAQDILSILHGCRGRNSREHVLLLYGYVRKNGLEMHASLCNCLISMLLQVGCIHEAQQVFDSLQHRTSWSWNTLITGCIRGGNFCHALNLYRRMPKDHLRITRRTYVALLKACGKLKDMEIGFEIHVDTARIGLVQYDSYIGTTLLDMYAKCGSLRKAWEVFEGIPVKNVVSWNALISAYVRNGYDLDALKCFERMQLAGISPDATTFTSLLKGCTNIGDIEVGHVVHTEIEKNHVLEMDLIVGSALVDMYCKFGMITDSRLAFDRLPVRDSVSWTALIAGLAEHGHGDEALKCFEQMQVEGIPVDDIALVCILKACGALGSLEKGQQVHANIEISGLVTRQLVVGNMLVEMYVKCGFLGFAEHLFDRLPVRDIAAWNYLIVGYSSHGFNVKVLQFFEQMQLEGISPNAVTFVCGLKASSNVGAMDQYEKMHTEILTRGLLDRDVLLGNTLIDLYMKNRLFVKAREVFDNLSTKTIVSWTSLVNGYAEHGKSKEAIECFDHMLLEGGVHADAIAFISCLKACSSIGAIDKGQNLHLEIETNRLLEGDSAIGSALVSMYARFGLIKRAREVFDKLAIRTIFSWTALVSGYAEQGHGEEALKCLEQLSRGGLAPDDVTCICSLKACASVGAIGKGQEIHAQIVRTGLLESDPTVGVTLVHMYAKCGLPTVAQKVFDKLLVQDTASWNSLIAGYAQLGDAENVFGEYDKMIKESIQPDAITFLSILNACSCAGLIYNSLGFHEAMSRDYGIVPMFEHHACIIDILARVGQIDMALAMIKRMPFNPDLEVWHAVLGSCRNLGNSKLGEETFKTALSMGTQHAAAYVLMSHIYADDIP